MRNKVIALLVALSLSSLPGVALGGELSSSVSAQRQQTADLDQLKKAIEKLEEIDKDPNRSPVVKEQNRRYLQELRSQYETALNNELSEWRKYLEDIRSLPDEGKKKEVEGKVLALEQELRKLRGDSSGPVVIDTSPVAVPKAAELKQSTADKRLQDKTDDSSAQNPTPIKLEPLSVTPTTNQYIEVKDCSKIDKATKTFSLYERYVCQTIKRVKDRKTKGEVFGSITTKPDANASITGVDDFVIALALISKLANPDYLLKAEESRTDKQVGAGPQSSGTTSLVVKGSAPTILGLAVENGALTQSVSGSTVTFHGNPVGILQALANRGYRQSFEESENNGFLRILKPFSFSLSFDTSRGKDQTSTSPGNMTPAMPNVLTADKQQLSQVTARYEFINHRDPRRKEYRKQWEDFLAKEAEPLTSKVHDVLNALMKEPDLQKWRADLQTDLAAANPEEVEKLVKTRFTLLTATSLTPKTVEIIKSLDQSFGEYIAARKNLLDRIAKSTVVTFEYTNTRNVNSPNLSNFRLIAEKGPGGNVDATFNGSLTIFDKIPSGMSKRIRDFQFSGQLDYKARNPFGLGDLIFFASGKYERLMEDTMDPAGMTIPDTKGDVAIAQVGVKIPVNGSGFKIPISFSVANRTELIKEKEVRGNIGITFDLDTLFSKVKP